MAIDISNEPAAYLTEMKQLTKARAQNCHRSSRKRLKTVILTGTSVKEKNKKQENAREKLKKK